MSNKYSVREAGFQDVNHLSKLFMEFIGQPSNIDFLQKQLKIISKDPNYFVSVACENQKVIGTAMGIICYDLVGNCKPFLLIENVVVSPEHRNKGVGKLLMNSLEDFGRSHHCNYVMLVSHITRIQAHKFYESIGFEIQAGFKKRLNSQT